jgi:hypothetical protein
MKPFVQLIYAKKLNFKKWEFKTGAKYVNDPVEFLKIIYKILQNLKFHECSKENISLKWISEVSPIFFPEEKNFKCEKLKEFMINLRYRNSKGEKRDHEGKVNIWMNNSRWLSKTGEKYKTFNFWIIREDNYKKTKPKHTILKLWKNQRQWQSFICS